MTLYNRYILTVATSMLLTVTALAAVGEESISIYYTLFIVEALAITELFVYFSPKARRHLAFVSVLLFGGFAISLCLQIIKILVPR